MDSIIIGLAAGAICYFAVAVVKAKFGYDDSLDAFGVHGIGGTVGALLTGVFARIALTWVFSGVATFVILKIVDAIIGVRVSTGDESVGLDLSQHGEEAYHAH